MEMYEIGGKVLAGMKSFTDKSSKSGRVAGDVSRCFAVNTELN